MISLDCNSKRLNDSQTGDLLNAFLTTPGVSQVAWIDLHFNQLTRIPAQIRSFPKLVYIDVSFNTIDVFQSGDFNFVSSNKLTTLWGNGNRLKSIAPGAFEGLVKGL
jgi:Leucine-rich repeat (LRR) protein